jgi:hypothetical protein
MQLTRDDLPPEEHEHLVLEKWRAPKSRGETHLRVSQSQVAESWDLVAPGFQL